MLFRSEVGDAFRAYMSKGIEGYCHLMSGDPELGRRLTEEALAYAEQIGTSFYVAVVQAYHARCLISLGDRVGAENVCRLAIESSLAEAQGKTCAYHALAHALHSQDSTSIEPVENALHHAITLAKEMRYRPELARTYLSYAHMLGRWGRSRESESYRNEAVRMFRDMGMDGSATTSGLGA